MLTAMLDKIRPAIQEQITQSNSFYFYYKKKGYDLGAPGKIKLPPKEPEMRKFECTEGKSNKYWDIAKPYEIGKGGSAVSSEWIVRVRYGRIGTSGQTHSKVFPMSFQAHDYYDRKIIEKVAKGYVEHQGIKVAKPKAAVIKKTFDLDDVVAECEHSNLSRKGNSWKCWTCGHTVELMMEASVGVVEEKVKRFINLNWKDEE
jgi:predicted DNA-binding WGR domain protein